MFICPLPLPLSGFSSCSSELLAQQLEAMRNIIQRAAHSAAFRREFHKWVCGCEVKGN